MNETLKRYLISSVITFVSAAGIFFLSNLSVESIDNAALMGLVFAAVRVGLKALFEFLPTLLKK